MSEPIRIAMWSGPRNISTAMMRSFENREDCAVSDEPFYAAYLVQTGLDHPMRAEILASQPRDWRDVVKHLLGPPPKNRPVWYQKHMTHHMLPDFERDWIVQMRNAFLIRAPEEVLASYTQKREEVSLADIGFVQQREMFDREADRLGHAPPVVEGKDVLADPRGMLARLCEALAIPFSQRMMSWPAGNRDSDGVWAPAWYDTVEKSTGFAKPAERAAPKLSPDLQRIADEARPHYERLVTFKLRA